MLFKWGTSPRGRGSCRPPIGPLFLSWKAVHPGPILSKFQLSTSKTDGLEAAGISLYIAASRPCHKAKMTRTDKKMTSFNFSGFSLPGAWETRKQSMGQFRGGRLKSGFGKEGLWTLFIFQSWAWRESGFSRGYGTGPGCRRAIYRVRSIH